MWPFPSKGIREFCNAMIANPHDWVQGHYNFTNVKHPDMAIWTCNGLWFIKIGGNEGLSLSEKALVLASVKLTTARRLTTPKPAAPKEDGKEG